MQPMFGRPLTLFDFEAKLVEISLQARQLRLTLTRRKLSGVWDTIRRGNQTEIGLVELFNILASDECLVHRHVEPVDPATFLNLIDVRSNMPLVQDQAPITVYT